MRARATLVAATSLCLGLSALAQGPAGVFERMATFPVFLNTCDGQPDSCVSEETVAEIVTVSSDGNLLIYTDSATENIGFVDITDPKAPKPAGLVAMTGEPTSVAVTGEYALAAVNTSESYASPSGHLAVIHVPTRTIVRTIDLGGQPDSITVSQDNRYAAIAIENERNEALCVGGALDGQEVGDDACEQGGGRLGWLPQAPAGYLVIVDLIGRPSLWKTRKVDLTGLAAKFPGDPEPEFVDISVNNVAAVTLQENNHIVLVHLPTGKVVNHFSAGEVDLSGIDIEENDLIELTGSIAGVPREPDAVAWLSPNEFATADEGDPEGGSRGFTIFRDTGAVRFAAGNAMEHRVVRHGRYPEDRSENKGNELEGAEFGQYGGRRFLFVGSERSNVVGVYQVMPNGTPELSQVLPASVGPEGLLAIPDRNLFVIASEVDARNDAIRSSIAIYEYRFKRGAPAYPTVVSRNRADGTPIPWAALSGLAGDPYDGSKAYAVYDSFYGQSRIFVMDVSRRPAVITDEIVLTDAGGNTVNFDPEGIAARPSGLGFWIASEGRGSCSAVGVCAGALNYLLDVTKTGEIRRLIQLPAAVNARQVRFGFEGVASVGVGDDEVVYVAFQREWLEDPARHVRIGRYEVATGQWTFYYYPLDARESPNGGWVGLSELVALDEETFAVVERDNQGGKDARIKRIYKFSIEGLTPKSQEAGGFPVVSKTLVRDLTPDLEAPKGLVIEKVEGMGVLANGDTILVTDNDGVDDNSGETRFLNLGKLF